MRIDGEAVSLFLVTDEERAQVVGLEAQIRTLLSTVVGLVRALGGGDVPVVKDVKPADGKVVRVVGQRKRRQKFCVMCGATFAPKTSEKTCSVECRRKREAEQAAMANQQQVKARLKEISPEARKKLALVVERAESSPVLNGEWDEIRAMLAKR
jgi:predicted nucleic acid-binding Zn ribbon protein